MKNIIYYLLFMGLAATGSIKSMGNTPTPRPAKDPLNVAAILHKPKPMRARKVQIEDQIKKLERTHAESLSDQISGSTLSDLDLMVWTKVPATTPISASKTEPTGANKLEYAALIEQDRYKTQYRPEISPSDADAIKELLEQ